MLSRRDGSASSTGAGLVRQRRASFVEVCLTPMSPTMCRTMAHTTVWHQHSLAAGYQMPSGIPVAQMPSAAVPVPESRVRKRGNGIKYEMCPR